MGIAYIIIGIIIEIFIFVKIINIRKSHEDNIDKRLYELEKMKIIVVIVTIFIVLIGIIIGFIQFGVSDFIDEVIKVIQTKIGRNIFDESKYHIEGYEIYRLIWKRTEIERLCITIIAGIMLGIGEYIVISKSIKSNERLKKIDKVV